MKRLKPGKRDYSPSVVNATGELLETGLSATQVSKSWPIFLEAIFSDGENAGDREKMMCTSTINTWGLVLGEVMGTAIEHSLSLAEVNIPDSWKLLLGVVVPFGIMFDTSMRFGHHLMPLRLCFFNFKEKQLVTPLLKVTSVGDTSGETQCDAVVSGLDEHGLFDGLYHSGTDNTNSMSGRGGKKGGGMGGAIHRIEQKMVARGGTKSRLPRTPCTMHVVHIQYDVFQKAVCGPVPRGKRGFTQPHPVNLCNMLHWLHHSERKGAWPVLKLIYASFGHILRAFPKCVSTRWEYDVKAFENFDKNADDIRSCVFFYVCLLAHIQKTISAYWFLVLRWTSLLSLRLQMKAMIVIANEHYRPALCWTKGADPNMRTAPGAEEARMLPAGHKAHLMPDQTLKWQRRLEVMLQHMSVNCEPCQEPTRTGTLEEYRLALETSTDTPILLFPTFVGVFAQVLTLAYCCLSLAEFTIFAISIRRGLEKMLVVHVKWFTCWQQLPFSVGRILHHHHEPVDYTPGCMTFLHWRTPTGPMYARAFLRVFFPSQVTEYEKKTTVPTLTELIFAQLLRMDTPTLVVLPSPTLPDTYMLAPLCDADPDMLEEVCRYAYAVDNLGVGQLGPKLTLWGFIFVWSQYITTHLIEGDFCRADGQFDKNMLMSTLSSRMVSKGKHTLQKRGWSKSQLTVARGQVAGKRARRKLVLDPDGILLGVVKSLDQVQKDDEKRAAKKKEATEKAAQKETDRLAKEAQKEADRLAREAQREADRLAREAQREHRRVVAEAAKEVKEVCGFCPQKRFVTKARNMASIALTNPPVAFGPLSMWMMILHAEGWMESSLENARASIHILMVSVLLVNNQSKGPENSANMVVEGVEDLTMLKSVEGCDDVELLLDNLLARCKKEKYYSFVGSVLLSMNPYKWLDIYNDEHVKKYYDQKTNEPHIYWVADNAYRNMMRCYCLPLPSTPG
ncbi:hypothetical protein CYMTET_25282 [Cymbomonas tetramitiformis]|uniref:Myosin motor domain-containing protein n=1 Tax=Cymbomonas tetramitiformis TaxID=36881 RepID=A0AAE0KZ72_9CHLO|nr:hypothetical protein CYMTET_25282 [Cymbomonas tetramitiformis]